METKLEDQNNIRKNIKYDITVRSVNKGLTLKKPAFILVFP